MPATRARNAPHVQTARSLFERPLVAPPVVSSPLKAAVSQHRTACPHKPGTPQSCVKQEDDELSRVQKIVLVTFVWVFVVVV